MRKKEYWWKEAVTTHRRVLTAASVMILIIRWSALHLYPHIPLIVYTVDLSFKEPAVLKDADDIFREIFSNEKPE